MDHKRLLDLLEDVFKIACFIVRAACKGVAVHRITAPHHMAAVILNSPDQVGQLVGNLVAAVAGNEYNLALFVSGVQAFKNPDNFKYIHFTAHFDPDRIADATEILNMGLFRITCPVSDPWQVCSQVVPSRRMRYLPGLGRLIVEIERFVRGVHIDLLQGNEFGGKQFFHEVDGIQYGPHHRLVLLVVLVFEHEIELPVLRVMQIGKTSAFGKCPHEIERHGRFLIGLVQAARIGLAQAAVGFDGVEQVAAVNGYLLFADYFTVARARLGVLPGHASYTNNGNIQFMDQDKTHLKHHLQQFHNVYRVAVVERFGTIASLQQKCFAPAGLFQLFLEGFNFPGCNQRRVRLQFAETLLKKFGIGIIGHLPFRERAPAQGRPCT